MIARLVGGQGARTFDDRAPCTGWISPLLTKIPRPYRKKARDPRDALPAPSRRDRALWTKGLALVRHDLAAWWLALPRAYDKLPCMMPGTARVHVDKVGSD